MEGIPGDCDFWTNEDLAHDPRWNGVRHLAKEALTFFGGPVEAPPPGRV